MSRINTLAAIRLYLHNINANIRNENNSYVVTQGYVAELLDSLEPIADRLGEIESEMEGE